MTDRYRLLRFAGVVTGLLVASACSDPASNADPPAPIEVSKPSPSGLGDPYYPDDGNGGYDVRRYAVDLDYTRTNQSIRATTRVFADAKRRLESFHLDLTGMKVTRIRVADRAAKFKRSGAHELVITPKKPIAKGKSFVTAVTYHGKPRRIDEGGVPSGWYDATTPGAGFIAGEPHSCTLWYPCNDHPTDKAEFWLTATVPRPFAVVSNGVEGKVTPATLPGDTKARTFRWRLHEATATYLTTIYIDKLTFERSTLADGTPVVSAYGPDPGEAPAREALLPEILEALSERWGPYPAPQAGGIFVSGEVPFSLETYTRPIYTEGADISTIAHENGHQWWGDNISVKRWRDICFNECLASYSQWLWDEHEGADLDGRYLSNVDGSPGWFDSPLYDMGPGHEFDYEGVYLKGTYFVHALRNKIGDDEFFAAMQEIQAERAGGNMSMTDLRNELEDKTGVDLDSFWDEWVFSTGVPSDANLYPGDLAP